MNTLIPLLSTIISLIFAATVFAQWLSRRRPHQLVWTIGLIAYGIGAGSEFVAGSSQWTDTTYRLWYLFGALLVAAYLGMGTVYLLMRDNRAHAIMAILVLATLYSSYRVFTAPVKLALMPGTMIPASGIMPVDVAILTGILNAFGSIALVGGAAYSAWVFWRKRILPQRLVSCILIAAGGFMPVVGGSMLRAGIPALFFLFELLGVAVIFAGFLANNEIVASRFTAQRSLSA